MMKIIISSLPVQVSKNYLDAVGSAHALGCANYFYYSAAGASAVMSKYCYYFLMTGAFCRVVKTLWACFLWTGAVCGYFWWFGIWNTPRTLYSCSPLFQAKAFKAVTSEELQSTRKNTNTSQTVTDQLLKDPLFQTAFALFLGFSSATHMTSTWPSLLLFWSTHFLSSSSSFQEHKPLGAVSGYFLLLARPIPACEFFPMVYVRSNDSLVRQYTHRVGCCTKGREIGNFIRNPSPAWYPLTDMALNQRLYFTVWG